MPKAMRVRHGFLQTPVIRYVNNAGREVTLVLTSHVGEQLYYRQLRKVTARLEAAGATVRFEMVSPAPAEDWAAASLDEHAALKALDDHEAMAAAVTDYLGWRYQGDSLDYSPSWQNADMTDLDLVRAIGARNILDSARATRDTLAMLGDQRDTVLGASASVMLRLLALDRSRFIMRHARRSEADRAAEEAVVAQRDKVALAALPQAGDGVLLWGAGHVNGISDGLRRAGFAPVATGWLAVGKLPPLWRCVADICRGIAAMRRA